MWEKNFALVAAAALRQNTATELTLKHATLEKLLWEGSREKKMKPAALARSALYHLEMHNSKAICRIVHVAGRPTRDGAYLAWWGLVFSAGDLAALKNSSDPHLMDFCTLAEQHSGFVGPDHNWVLILSEK